MPANVTNFLVTRTSFGPDSGNDVSYPLDDRWLAVTYQGSYWVNPIGDGTFSIPASAFTNGVALILPNQVPPYGACQLDVQTFGTDGRSGGPFTLWRARTVWGPGQEWDDSYTFGTIPFMDATAQMKNNLAFLMSWGWGPFAATPIVIDTNSYFDPIAVMGNTVYYPSNYVCSSYYMASGDPNPFMPYEDNCIFSNFQYNVNLATSGNPSWFPPGIYGLDNGNNPCVAVNRALTFPTASYVAAGSAPSVSPSLTVSNNQWFLVPDPYFGPDEQGYPPYLGVYQNGSLWSMSGGYTNNYGLRYESFEVNNGEGPFALLSPTQSVPAGVVGFSLAYSSVQPPAFSTVGYYFVRQPKIYGLGYYVDPSTYTGPLPGSDSFDPTNTTQLMITGIGQTLHIAGYAKQVASNGSPNVFAYLGQYFTNAWQMQNGALTTNIAGIVSEYGSFFPTLPGQIALMTKPDPDQGNQQGQCFINVIRLSLDVNHDGIMDESYTGPDNTTADRPFQFWANNNYDRWTSSILDSAPFQDDVASTDSAANSPYTGLPVPDYDYRDANGQRMIPCTRDLQDFTRLWVSGVSNTLSRLPSGSTVTLSWAGNGTSPTIDLFQAADADGGMGYLTNETTASNQINTNLCQYVGRLGTGGSIQLNASTFSNGWAGDHYIWCGVWYGSDQLNLTVSDGNGNVLAQSSQWIQIQDIKQMYERWTVGDNDDNLPLAQAVPMSNAVPVANGFSPGCPTLPFTYSYNAAYDTNDTYILYVHGWNEEVWRKDRWAESAYKRLYWQGYQGRFGLFRWPCFNLSFVNAVTRPHYYDWSEWNAWKTGQSLETFLANTLNKNYPNHVYLLAHSQGNVVAGEALRLAPSRVVNTYVASQGALSARAFDNTLPTNAASYYTITTSDPQGNYYTNGAPSYFSASAGAGTYVNFFNTNDWALMGNSISLAAFHPGWLYDQSLKPDANLKFYYEAPSPTVPSGYYYYPLVAGNYQVVPLIFPTNTYEVFAMCAQSYSRALGAQVGVNGPFLSRQINLSASPYNFGSTHIQHDEQFTFDNMTTSAYWQQLLVSFALKPTP